MNNIFKSVGIVILGLLVVLTIIKNANKEPLAMLIISYLIFTKVK